MVHGLMGSALKSTRPDYINCLLDSETMNDLFIEENMT